MRSHCVLLKAILLSLLVSIASMASPKALAENEKINFFELKDATGLSASATRFFDAVKCSSVYFQNLDLTGSAFCFDEDVIWLHKENASGVEETIFLPALPVDVERVTGAIKGNALYAATETTLFTLDLTNTSAGWTPVYTFPESARRDGPIAALNSKIYVLSTSGSIAYDLRLKTFKAIAPSPAFGERSFAFTSGDAHIFVISYAGDETQIWGYHIITDSWFEGSDLSLPANLRGIVSNGTSFALITPGSVISGATVMRPLPFGVLDMLAIALVLIAILSIGVLQSRGSKSSKDYFRGGGTIPWWAAGLSLFATLASAISIMSMPAMAFAGDWTYFSIGIFSVMVMVPLFLFVFVPVIRRLNMPTANAYLEKRFGLSVRLLGFFSFSMNQILGRVAAILLLPAIAINSIFGIPIPLSILITGLCTTAFVTFGGLKAVIWTDVLLAVVMILAVATTLGFLIFMLDFSPLESWSILQEKDKLKVFDFRLDWTAPVALVLFLNTLATSLGFISDQNFVQRVQSTKTERMAKRASVSQLMVAVPLNVLLFGLGSLLFLYFSTRPELISPAMKMDGILPYFAAISLPPGLGGFVVAALLAATVSTISSALNSVSNLGVEDIYKRFQPEASEKQCMTLARVLTVVLGVVGTVLALILASLSGMQSIWNLFLMVTGLIIGPVTGVFILGIFTNRANSLGVWIGCISAVVANAYATFFLNLHATVFLVVGLSVTLIVGYLASYLSGKPSLKSEGLTIYTLPEGNEVATPA